MQFSWRQIRTYTVTGLTVVVYVWLSYLIGAGEIDTTKEILQVLLQVGICILLLPILSIDYQDLSLKTIVRIGVLLLVINLVFWGWPLLNDWYRDTSLITDTEAVRLLLKLLGIVSLHVGLTLFFVYKVRVFQVRRSYHPGILYFSGVGTLSIFLAAAFALLVGGSYGTISLSCDNMFGQLERAAWHVLPGVSSRPEVDKQLTAFKEATFGDILSMSSTGDETVSTGSVSATGATGSNFSLEQFLSGGKLGALTDDVQLYYHQFVEQVVSQKASVDEKICNSLLDQIEVVSQTSTFRISLIVLLFVLLGPIITLVMYILLGIGTCVLYLLYLLGIYHWETYETTGETLR